MSDFFGKIKSGAGKVAFEADKMNRTNKAKSELEHLKKQVEDTYSKIGQLYYSQHQTLVVTGPAFDDLCTSIDAIQQQIQGKNDEIQHVSAEAYNSPVVNQPQASQPIPEVAPTSAPAAPATKFCSNCGKEMPVAVKFCPDCGNKM